MNKNGVKLGFSLFLSLLGSDSMKLVAGVYLYNETKIFILSTLIYFFTQLPTLIAVFAFKKIKVHNYKKNIIRADVASFTASVMFFTLLILSSNFVAKMVFIYMLSFILSLIHSIRYPSFRASISYLSDDIDEISFTNNTITFVSVISIGLGPLLGLFSKWIMVEWYVLFDAITYIISGVILATLKYREVPFVRDGGGTTETKVQFGKFTPYIFVGVISLFSFFKYSTLLQMLSVKNVDLNTWYYYIVGGSVIGSLVAVSLGYTKWMRKILDKIRFWIHWIVASIPLVILLAATLLNTTTNVFLTLTITITIIVNLFFSLSMTSYYTSLYMSIPPHKIGQTTTYSNAIKSAYSMFFNIVISSFVSKQNSVLFFSIMIALVVLSNLALILSVRKSKGNVIYE